MGALIVLAIIVVIGYLASLRLPSVARVPQLPGAGLGR
jgi:hypothetical protein